MKTATPGHLKVLRVTRGLLMAILLLGWFSRTEAAAAPLLLGDEDRILILAPHPDDETLAAGGLIQEAIALELPVRVCFFTMGDNNEIASLFTRKHPVQMPGAVPSMGTLRRKEAIAAATQLGLSTNDLVFLGYPDSGTLDIWNHHWRKVPPFRSMITRANAVPYNQALTPGSAYASEDILDDLEEVILEFRPTMVLVSHPADHNVDHRAFYLFTRVALWHLEPAGILPDVLAYPVHFTQWPEPRQYHPMRPAAPPYFLYEPIDWREYVLAPYQVSNKFAAIQRHHSQFLSSSAVLDSFVRKTELFGDYPDLSLPGGTGSVDIEEEDPSQFRPDEALFQELSRQSGQWTAIADQNASESASLEGDDNEFIRRSLSGDGTHLELSFQFAQPVVRPSILVVSLFGYRADTPFGDMPKIVVALTSGEIVAVKNIDTRPSGALVELVPGDEDEIIFRVPLSLLGDPEKLLMGARIKKGSLPVDWVPWRAVDLAPTLLADPPAGPAHEIASVEVALPAVDERVSPDKPANLTPRVRLPRKSIPERSEANEPVLW